LSDRAADLFVEIGFDHAARQHIGCRDRTSGQGLAFDCPLDNPLTPRLRDLAVAILDIFGLLQRNLNLAVRIAGVDRVFGDHRLRHANRAARHQGDARGGGGELCSGHFDRHKTEPCHFCRLTSDHPRLHQLQCSCDAAFCRGCNGVNHDQARIPARSGTNRADFAGAVPF
jgi:hypothetical protein